MFKEIYSIDKTTVTHEYKDSFGMFYLFLWKMDNNILCLSNFEVEEPHSKKGYGRFLFNQALEKAANLKLDYILIGDYDDKNAKHFWEHITKRKFGRGIVVPVEQALKDIDGCGKINTGTCFEFLIKNLKEKSISYM